jgi:hypothetical protein
MWQLAATKQRVVDLLLESSPLFPSDNCFTVVVDGNGGIERDVTLRKMGDALFDSI